MGNAIFEPVTAHVEGFGSSHADFPFENIVCGGVVGFERSTGWWLFVAHFFKSSDDRSSFLSVDEQASSFSFGCRRGSTFDSFAEDVDCAVFRRFWRICRGSVTEDADTGATAAGVWEHKTGGISNDMENHVAGVETNGGIRMGCEIIEQMIAGIASDSMLVGDLVWGRQSTVQSRARP